MATERWKPIPGYEDKYAVSNLGNVRSYYRGSRLLRPGRMPSGHMSVALGRGNSRTVHSLVLEAFVGPRPAGQEVRHLNGNPADNRLVNLAYGTRTQNILDAIEHGSWFSPSRIAHNKRLCAANAKRFRSPEFKAKMRALRG